MNHQQSSRGVGTDRPGVNSSTRKCFVTVGATAGFRQLLNEILEPRFLERLVEFDYDLLEVQCGPDYEWFSRKIEESGSNHGLHIQSFKYTQDMKAHMLECRGEKGGRGVGCVISHAGECACILFALSCVYLTHQNNNPTRFRDNS
jgi:UDP-N-acetylglucosamine transferase subunit ALG13